MPGYDDCPRCGQFANLARHRCPPEWLAFHADYMAESEADPAFGHSADGAAESYAERRFADWEYPEEMEIWVKKGGTRTGRSSL